MKKLLLSLGGLALLFAAEAAPVTPEEALSRLAGERAVMSAPSGIRLMRTVDASDGMPAVYVFGTGDAVSMFVSADDLARPLLGRLDSAPSAGEDMPVQLEEWLADISESIMEARSRNLSPVRVVEAGDDVATRKAIEPLLSTKWGQGNPYNAMCPKIMNSSTGREEPALTGCVATALAQLIYHNRYPKRSTGTGSAASGETMDLDIEYDFDNMLDTYSGEYNYFQGVAVSRLMAACGFAVEMDYGLGGSSAYDRNALKALRTNFGYSKAELHSSSNFSHKEWDNMIWDNLHNGYPVYYSAGSRGGGHAFLIDGYNDNYYHFNWGWTGSYDGYFLIDYLLPAGDYHRRHAAIVNIVPDDENYTYTIPSYPYVIDIERISGNKVSVSFWNNNNRENIFNVGLIYENVDDSADRFESVKGRNIDLEEGHGFKDYYFSVGTANESLRFVPGATYRAMPAYGKGNDVLEPMRISYPDTPGFFYVHVGKMGDFEIIVPEMVFPWIELDNVPSYCYLSSSSGGSTMKLMFSGSISNNSSNEIQNTLRPVLLKKEDDENYTILGEGLSYKAWMMPNEKTKYEFTTDFLSLQNSYILPGRYYFAFLSYVGNVPVSDIFEIDVKSYPGFGKLKVNKFSPVGDNALLAIDNLSYVVDVECSDGVYNKTLDAYLWLYPPYGSTSIESNVMRQEILLESGERYHWEPSFKSELAQPGMRYKAALYIYTSQSNRTYVTFSGKIGEASAIDDIFAEDDAEGIDAEAPVYDLTGRMVAPRFGDAQLAPGIYMVGTRKIAVR